MFLTPGRDTLPTSLRKNARWTTIGPTGVPTMTVHPHRAAADGGEATATVPLVIWMHGRTASKELDPGRYLRWMRAGIGSCAVDLPGHGERLDPSLQTPEATLDAVARMVDEIDPIVAAVDDAQDDGTHPLGGFDPKRIAIGGMSAGGLVALARLCRPHRFACATVEATTGAWGSLRSRVVLPQISAALDPISHLDRWRPIPLLALHARHDEWIPVADQRAFIEALRARDPDPTQVEFEVFERTGAPAEHIGFGRFATAAKERQLEFLQRRLVGQ